MPGLTQKNDQYFNSSSALYSLSANGFWSKQRDGVGYNQVQKEFRAMQYIFSRDDVKFWGELSPKSRQELLRIDKQTLFELARRNMYCSRCNGLLLEGFLQIVMYGKSLQQDGICGDPLNNKVLVSKNQIRGGSNIIDGCQDEIQDPSVHPWGGLTTTREGSLTLMDCYLYSKTLLGLQSVFDSARGRERERELLYPDACGGGGRGWISQGMTSYGRGHGTREACALHTAKLSCDTLVDFWSALGEETRQSLLRMKEEDFIERLMYRFDSKRFCRDCRRNVIREFKELKELKRMRREPQCTRWFCVADTAFQYEVSDCTIQADWRQTFADTVGTYNHFEWAVGTGEGKSDILKFENVGLNGSVKVNDLSLTGLSSCVITLRAWKVDGRCTEFSVKAHALKGQQCVHCRLTVGDGFVSIARGDNIKMFFEHAEEAEEEEDDDSIDMDGNELDGECSRPQKHAKSPELAREFLLDAATVIFKEQVEKAFREGTARQNAHSVFVCLALKLLEERVHIACKEIVTSEKQTKLLEEEEKEKREEEERKERRRNKEREKKIRRKERLKGKEKNKDMKCSESIDTSVLVEVSKDDSSLSVDEEPNTSISCRDLVREMGDAFLYLPGSPSIADELSNEFDTSRTQSSYDSPDRGEITNVKDGSGSFTVEQSKFSRRRLKLGKEYQVDQSWKWSDRCRFDAVSETSALNCRSEPRYHSESFDSPLRGVHGPNRHIRTIIPKSFGRHGSKTNEKYHCSNNRVTDRYDYHSCSCSQSNEYRSKLEHYECSSKVGREAKLVGKSEPPFNMSKQLQRCIRYNQVDYDRDSCGRAKSKSMSGTNPSRKELSHSKKVWEPMESQKKYSRSKSGSDVMRKQTELVADDKLTMSNGTTNIGEDGEYPCELDQEENNLKNSKASTIESEEGEMNHEGSKECESLTAKSSISVSNETSDLSESSSFNPNISSSCPSVDSSTTTSSNNENAESSFASDSEDANQHSEVVTSVCAQNGFFECQEVGMGENQKANGIDDMKSRIHMGPSPRSSTINDLENMTSNISPVSDRRMPASQSQGTLPPMQNQNVYFPMFQAPGMGYYHQNPVPWPASVSNSGLMSVSHPNHCFYADALGYGANGSSPLCMQYGPLQHLATPVFNPGLVPLYHPVDKSEDENSERMQIFNKGGAFEVSNGVKTDRIIPTGLNARQAPPNRLDKQNDCFSSTKLKMESNTFSFFHFGGPPALSKGSKSDPLLSEERLVKDFSTRYNEHAYHKETTVEEYNLFAASQISPFSFFCYNNEKV